MKKFTSCIRSKANGLALRAQMCIRDSNEPVKANFEAFVYEAELINANLTSAINSLKMKVPNRVFHCLLYTSPQCRACRSTS